jgi:hypothetical protein
VALGYDALRARLPVRWAGTALFLALTGALVWGRTSMMSFAVRARATETRDRDAYRSLAVIGREHGGGALLELPYVSTLLVDHVPEEMVVTTGGTGCRSSTLQRLSPTASIVHREPHRRHPAARPLDDLIDTTTSSLIVIRPEDVGGATPRRRLLAGLARYPGIGPSWTAGPWVVQRLDRVPEHDAWFQALAAGPQAGRSVLGTPLAPLTESDAIASISTHVSPGPVLARWFVGIEASATNRGSAAWPTWAAGGWNQPGLVQWRARWRRADDAAAPWSAPHAFPLRHDVAPGETLAQQLIVPTPEQPGSYELQITLAQQDGAAFSASGNEVGTIRLEVAPPRP